MELEERDLDSGQRHQKHLERLPSVVENDIQIEKYIFEEFIFKNKFIKTKKI